MRGFNLPKSMGELFAISAETHAEAWAVAIEQASTVEQCLSLQLRLYHRLELLRDREMPCGVERAALIAVADRAVALIRERIASPPPAEAASTRRRPFAVIVF